MKAEDLRTDPHSCSHHGEPLNSPRARGMGFIGRPCGAHARSTGKPCRAQALRSGRCKHHGGLSTGPRTAAGKRAAALNLQRWRERQAALKAHLLNTHEKST